MKTPDTVSLTRFVKESLFSEGFGPVGIAPALPHPEDAGRTNAWIEAGNHGSLTYMVRSVKKRADITTLLPGARSVIVAAINYYNEDIPATRDSYTIARYARGLDYHDVIKEKLQKVFSVIKTYRPGIEGRIFVDSPQVAEKAWAERAGVGQRGRNSLIINKETGSFFLLGEIVTTAELEYNLPTEKSICGDCHRCIDACPTGAINNNYTINVSKCISYHTIEARSEKPPQLLTNEPGNTIYGCDRCQEVCPWNSNAQHHQIKEFETSHELISLTRNDWENMSEGKFNRLFSKSPLARPGYLGIMHNIAAISGNKTT